MIASKLFSALIVVTTLSATPVFADPGKGWDVFNTGAGEKISVPPASRPSIVAGAGKGWDVFNTGTGQPLQLLPNYQGVSSHPGHGQGWDVFRAGVGEKL